MWTLRKERARRRRLPLKKITADTPLDEWHPILLGNVTPQRPRPLSPAEHQTMRAQVQEWLRLGIIRKCDKAPWHNNMVFVEKKNGRLRACVDCRPANAVTADYDWPLPRLQDLRHRLGGTHWMTRIDLADAFFRIKVPPVWRHLTTITCDDQDYHFLRMPFGLKTAPATFQKFLDHVLTEHQHYAYWYMDDILITARTLRQLRERTAKVKTDLKNQRCTVNEEKTEYEKRSLLFAGLWLSPNAVGPNGQKLLQTLALPIPRTKPELQSALGMVSYLRDFIPLAAHFTAQLHTRKTDPTLSTTDLEYHWTKLCQHIRKAATTLNNFDDTEDADLYTDASGYGLGAILLQKGHITAIASRKLTPAETRYSATDREHLSLVFAAQRFRIFLHRTSGETRVWNDHAANIHRNQERMSPRQTRWNTVIGQWIPTIRHVRGAENPADYASRWLLPDLGGQINTLTKEGQIV